MVYVIGKPKSIVWSLNLGVPAPCIENNEEHRSFIRVGKAAWLLSLLPEKLITINRAISELDNVRIPEYWFEENPYACDFEIVPEIAAGAVGYALSEHQREDLHVIIDIGAGTVDACIFRLQGNRGGNRYSLYAADVKPLGTLMYHRMMIEGGINASLSFAQKIWNHDVILPPIEKIHHFIISRKEVEIYLDKIKSQFERQVEFLVRRLIWFARQKKRRNSHVWETHGRLPVLMIGGGSSSEFFKHAVRQLDPWMQEHIYNSGIFLIPAVIPNLIEGGSPEYLTVAWGLSHRAPDIGEIIPADRIPDIEPLPKIDLDELYVGKEVV